MFRTTAAAILTSATLLEGAAALDVPASPHDNGPDRNGSSISTEPVHGTEIDRRMICYPLPPEDCAFRAPGQDMDPY